MIIERVPCLSCGHSRSKRLYGKFGLGIVRCSRCGFVFANPRLLETEALKRYSEEYFFNEYLPSQGATKSGYDLKVVRERHAMILDLCRIISPSGKRLLDVGSGAGFFLKAAEEVGWQAEGIELSETASAYARDVVKVCVHAGKIENAGLPVDTYDVVLMLDAIEHLYDPMAVLQKIHRILKPGGGLIIFTPDFHSTSRRILGKPWAVLSPAEHISYFTERTLRQTLEKAGFLVSGIRNQWGWNPEYTHDKNSKRYKTWKVSHRKLVKTGLFKKLLRINDLDVIASAEGRKLEWPGKPWRARVIGRLYERSKEGLRGDVLIAVARTKDF
ncbi:MAG: class I SAM-dependent methyltransferase [Candidatus Aminicenantales bacterium]